MAGSCCCCKKANELHYSDFSKSTISSFLTLTGIGVFCATFSHCINGFLCGWGTNCFNGLLSQIGFFVYPIYAIYFISQLGWIFPFCTAITTSMSIWKKRDNPKACIKYLFNRIIMGLLLIFFEREAIALKNVNWYKDNKIFWPVIKIESTVNAMDGIAFSGVVAPFQTWIMYLVFGKIPFFKKCLKYPNVGKKIDNLGLVLVIVIILTAVFALLVPFYMTTANYFGDTVSKKLVNRYDKNNPGNNYFPILSIIFNNFKYGHFNYTLMYMFSLLASSTAIILINSHTYKNVLIYMGILSPIFIIIGAIFVAFDFINGVDVISAVMQNLMLPEIILILTGLMLIIVIGYGACEDGDRPLYKKIAARKRSTFFRRFNSLTLTVYLFDNEAQILAKILANIFASGLGIWRIENTDELLWPYGQL